MGVALRIPLQFNSRASVFARLFSSSTAVTRRTWTYHEVAAENTDGESAVYKRALKLQRPTTVPYQENLHNSVSLIGVIDRPLKACNSAVLGVYTFLKVRAPAGPYREFTIMLKFWDEMAGVSVEHLKPRDLVYVSGRLQSYLKADEDGSLLRYEVDVKEMNFVAENSSSLASQNLTKFEPKVTYEDMVLKRRNRLHLWHVFFANPDEWWDNRKSKSKPGSPDFKHKDTGESLWLSQSDPPWINQQLQLYDSRTTKRSHVDQRNGWSHLSPLVYDEVEK